ncbi:hypothetical protein GCM10027451_15910 [Geodermatophilus aquaeductus]|uniref:Uncharacterized protein n=1 Tax=Geodermatophilus aquaeductus TaxID=1564161 RepID=A0A521DZL1_9ACTN|nr:hypothetical protein SAMN06273567_10411 [Geodermatophilus aquaeductus]
MSEYLDRMVGRTLGLLPTLRPRPRSRFEPSAWTGTDVLESAVEQDATGQAQGPTWSDPGRPADRSGPRQSAIPAAAAPLGQDGDRDDGGPWPDSPRRADTAHAGTAANWSPWPRPQGGSTSPDAVEAVPVRAPAGDIAVPGVSSSLTDLRGRPGPTPHPDGARTPSVRRAMAGGAGPPLPAGPSRSRFGEGTDSGRGDVRSPRDTTVAAAPRSTASGPRRAGGVVEHGSPAADTPSAFVHRRETAGRGPVVPIGPAEAAVDAPSATGPAAQEVAAEPARIAQSAAIRQPGSRSSASPGAPEVWTDDVPPTPDRLPIRGGAPASGPTASLGAAFAPPGLLEAVANLVPMAAARGAPPTHVGPPPVPRAGQRPGSGDSRPGAEVPAPAPTAPTAQPAAAPAATPGPPVAAPAHRSSGEHPTEGRTPDAPAPRVTVTIGRVEVRTPPVPPPVAPDPYPRPRQLSLDAYLGRRNSWPR